jgi:hypothetical protein
MAPDPGKCVCTGFNDCPCDDFYGVVYCCNVGVAHKRYIGPCQVFSGLGGASLRTIAGWAVWVTLLSLLSFISFVFFILVTLKMRWTLGSGSEPLRTQRRWFWSSRKHCIAWTIFAAGVWATCVASVELTFVRHNISNGVGNLRTKDLGQWMALCVAIATVIAFVWAALRDTMERSTEIKATVQHQNLEKLQSIAGQAT